MKICPACRFDRCDDTAERCRQCGADLTEDEHEEEHAGLAAAWFHYLEVPKIGTLELIPGQAFTLGREPRNNLVLPRCPDPEMLRIYWSDDYDEATVQLGQGSKATLKVDGTRVASTAKRTLRGGEEVEIGGLLLKYVKLGRKRDDAIPLSRLKGQGRAARRGVQPQQKVRGVGVRRPGDLRKAEALDPGRREMKAPPKPAGRSRSVATIRPADLVRAIEKSKAFGTLRIVAARERGWVTVKGGKPQHAALGDKAGHDALAAILRLGPCRCRLDPGLPKRTSGPALNITFGQALARIQQAAKRPPGRKPSPPPQHRRTSRKPWPR